MFECSRIANNSKIGFHDKLIYFISPQLYPTEKDKELDQSSISTSSYMNKKRIEDILNKQISPKQFNDFKKHKEGEIVDELEDMLPRQITKVHTVKFEAGTKITANAYECICL